MLKTLHLTRFGKFRERQFEFEAVTLFHGPNESGKSTLFDALKHILTPSRTRPFAIAPRKKLQKKLRKSSRRSESRPHPSNPKTLTYHAQDAPSHALRQIPRAPVPIRGGHAFSRTERDRQKHPLRCPQVRPRPLEKPTIRDRSVEKTAEKTAEKAVDDLSRALIRRILKL